MMFSSINTVAPTQTTAPVSKVVPFEWNTVAQPKQSIDTVNLSPEAIAAQRQEQYALKTDPMEFYNNWLDTEQPRSIRLEGVKPYVGLLPETQAYVDQLNERFKQAKTREQREDIQALISGASRFGDKEMIQSDSDVQTRWKVEGIALNLQMAHLEIYGEELAVPDSALPSERILEDLNMITREEMIRMNEAIGISREQTLADFKNIDKQNRAALENFFYGWVNDSRTLEDEFRT